MLQVDKAQFSRVLGYLKESFDANLIRTTIVHTDAVTSMFVALSSKKHMPFLVSTTPTTGRPTYWANSLNIEEIADEMGIGCNNISDYLSDLSDATS